MRQALARNAQLLPIVLIGGYVLVELVVDHQLRGGGNFAFPHLLIGGAFLIVAGVLMDRAAAGKRRVEEASRAALAESEEKYRLLFQNVTEGFALYELLYDEAGRPVDWQVLEVNEAYSRHTGIKREDIVGRRMSGLFPAAIPEYLPIFAKVVSTQAPVNFETYAAAVGRHQRVSTFPAGGSRFASIVEDISERKQAAAELSSSEEKFAKVFHHSPDAIGLVRVDTGVILDANEAFGRLLGHERSAAIGLQWEQLGLISVSDRARLAELFEKDRQVTDQELEFATRSGGLATLLVSLIPLTVSNVACILVIGHDLTARKRSEEALAATQLELAKGIEARVALEERQRLARELHDSVSQALYGISLGINTARTLYDADRQKTLEALDYAMSLTRAALTDMRALIFELRPESLENEGLVVALTKQADAVRARHEIEVELCLCEEPDIPLQAKEALYRIAREALQNAVKHAHTGRLDVQMTCAPDRLTLEVCDHGKGFDSEAAYPGHLGLKSMRERAEGLQGTLQILSVPDCGTQVVVSIPMEQTARGRDGS